MDDTCKALLEMLDLESNNIFTEHCQQRYERHALAVQDAIRRLSGFEQSKVYWDETKQKHCVMIAQWQPKE